MNQWRVEGTPVAVGIRTHDAKTRVGKRDGVNGPLLTVTSIYGEKTTKGN